MIERACAFGISKNEVKKRQFVLGRLVQYMIDDHGFSLDDRSDHSRSSLDLWFFEIKNLLGVKGVFYIIGDFFL